MQGPATSRWGASRAVVAARGSRTRTAGIVCLVLAVLGVVPALLLSSTARLAGTAGGRLDAQKQQRYQDCLKMLHAKDTIMTPENCEAIKPAAAGWSVDPALVLAVGVGLPALCGIALLLLAQRRSAGLRELARPASLAGLAALLLGLWSVSTTFGLIDALALGSGRSEDDLRVAGEEQAQDAAQDILIGQLLPVDLKVLAMLLLTAGLAWFVWRRQGRLGALAGWGLALAAGAMGVSFLTVAPVLPVVATSAVQAGAMDSDQRTPSPGDGAVKDVRLLTYLPEGSPPERRRAVGTLTNRSREHWESATIGVDLTDAGRRVCAHASATVQFVAPGQAVAFATPRIPVQPDRCRPVAVRATVQSVDVDSRTQRVASDYAHPGPAAVRPVVVEKEHMADRVFISVAAEAVARSGAPAPRTSFEVMDRQGRRLDWCFTTEPTPVGGRVVTGGYHSPVDRGQFVRAEAVAEC